MVQYEPYTVQYEPQYSTSTIDCLRGHSYCRTHIIYPVPYGDVAAMRRGGVPRAGTVRCSMRYSPY
eukprot:scaffold235739_cov44-Prasinocladus_malaysianus.AAC.1